MRLPYFNRTILSVFLALLFASAPGQAQIYKWVDANGQTHYSESPVNAGKAKTTELKIKSQPTPTASPQTWQEQERLLKQRQIEKKNQGAARTSAPGKPRSLSGGRSDETDASRCNLAKDVLSGAVRHGNGAATDDYDRQVAENDVRTYCH